MTRAELISRVQTKLDEKSPFDEPQSLIAAAGDSSYDKVKPITMYIDDLLDEAANDCLRMLPLSLVGADVQKLELSQVNVQDKVGVVPLKYEGIPSYNIRKSRFVRIRVSAWKKDVTSFITSSDPYYLVQQNHITRGKLCKPVVAIVPEKDCLELYSFLDSTRLTEDPITHKKPIDIFYIPCNKVAEATVSNIGEFIAIRCAELVCNIFGNQNAQVFQKEFTEKVNSVLQ